MSGAILSVPLLGVMKILLDAADFPLAKMLLVVIREDSDINEHAQMSEMVKQLPSYQMENTYSLKTESSERSTNDRRQVPHLPHPLYLPQALPRPLSSN